MTGEGFSTAIRMVCVNGSYGYCSGILLLLVEVRPSIMVYLHTDLAVDAFAEDGKLFVKSRGRSCNLRIWRKLNSPGRNHNDDDTGSCSLGRCLL